MRIGHAHTISVSNAGETLPATSSGCSKGVVAAPRHTRRSRTLILAQLQGRHLGNPEGEHSQIKHTAHYHSFLLQWPTIWSEPSGYAGMLLRFLLTVANEQVGP